MLYIVSFIKKVNEEKKVKKNPYQTHEFSSENNNNFFHSATEKNDLIASINCID